VSRNLIGPQRLDTGTLGRFPVYRYISDRTGASHARDEYFALIASTREAHPIRSSMVICRLLD
jgi:hypothetical protein